MADKRKKRKRKKTDTAKRAACAVIFAFAAVALFFYLNDSFFHISGVPAATKVLDFFGVGASPSVELADGEAAVYYIDVDQGDCELIVANGYNVLIDCGEDEYSYDAIGFIRKLGITKLDYVIATHPHSDHMGGMYRVLDEFDVGEFLMPEVSDEMIPTSKSYEKMLDAIEENNIPVSYARAGDTINLGTGSYLEIIAPLRSDYDNLNNYSITAKFVYGEMSFLFTGDIEKEVESEILQSGSDVSCNVLKVAHHGSKTSSTFEFLVAAHPQYAVICVGADNSYGHPTEEVLGRLEIVNSSILTTANSGNIVFTTDGSTIAFDTEKGDNAA